MGIYVFDKQVLHDLLNEKPQRTDFGREIIPAAAEKHNVQAYLFDDYWEDIGTIESFYNANLALTDQPDPLFSFYDEKAPIYTRSRDLPPSKLLDSHVIESMLGEGCILKECTVKRSVIGVRSRLETGCVIDNALLMGADYYESAAERLQRLRAEASRWASAPTRRSKKPSSIKTRASAAMCRSSTETGPWKATAKSWVLSSETALSSSSRMRRFPTG